MVSNEQILQKCKDLGIKCTARSNISKLKQKLTEYGVDLQTLQTKNKETVPQIGEIVEEVMKRINANVIPTQNNKKSSTKKKRSRMVEVSDSSEESEGSNTESSSSEEEPPKRKKSKKGKRTSFSRTASSLRYSVAPAVKSKILQGKYVPLYKLLPGFENRGQETASVWSEDGQIRLNVGDGNKDRRLGKQTLEVAQMLIALMKYKELISADFPTRVVDIDNYMANIVMVASKYSGKAYWFYHLYFWDRAAEYSERGEELNWSALDAEALHAAIANSSSANYCDQCQSWYHNPAQCPFSLRQESPSQESYRSPNGAGKSTSSSTFPLLKNRARAFYKGKEICTQFNYGLCHKKNQCPFLHMCKYCNRHDHSIKKCSEAPEELK